VNNQRIILAGGSGFLGSILEKHFASAGWDIVIFTRRPAKGEVFWDGKTLGPWTETLEGAGAVVNLAGRSINCRFTPKNRKEILESRVNATRVLGEAISHCKTPPEVWLNCSGAGIYNESFDTDIDETCADFSEAERGESFSGEVALLWERALNKTETPRTRKVALRISMVLGTRPGATFRILRRLARFGLAGRMGSGKQYVSWIHESDFCRIIEFVIQTPTLSGPINVTAPKPVPNSEFMRGLRCAGGRSFGLPAAEWMLEVGGFVMRTETELILDSRRVVPRRLIESGFQFRFPDLGSALQELETRLRNKG
jgi:uncharacterized protein (TIGR01777 family)